MTYAGGPAVLGRLSSGLIALPDARHAALAAFAVVLNLIDPERNRVNPAPALLVRQCGELSWITGQVVKFLYEAQFVGIART